MPEKKEEELTEEEKLTLLEKIKNASNGPEIASRRIKELDKMVKRMKQSRIDCQVRMDEDTKKLYWIEKEEESILSRYQPLLKQLEERKKAREQIKKEMQSAQEAITNMMNGSRNMIQKTRLATAHLNSKDASAELIASRGYSTQSSPKKKAK